ncbi:MAG: dTMP kinase [Candidatus Moraniibacteriota bacterium]
MNTFSTLEQAERLNKRSARTIQILTVSGLDGSGKSTQIELLKKSLESQGKKVFYFHAIEFSLANKIADFKRKYCLICKLTGKCKIPSNKETRSVTKANALQIELRKLFLKIDLFRFKKLLTKLASENFDYVLSDRYFYDSLINIEYLAKKEIDYSYSIVKPDVSICLQADPELIMSRDRVPDQGLQYLIDKKNIYDKYASIFEMKIVDGNENMDDIQQEIKALL